MAEEEKEIGEIEEGEGLEKEEAPSQKREGEEEEGGGTEAVELGVPLLRAGCGET